MSTDNTKSAVERAREFGIDISLTEENLRRTPMERLKGLEEWMKFIEEARRARERDFNTVKETEL
jgi:hypothetical protein